MTQSIIDIGDVPNDGTGDPVRDAFNKCNNNFTELYAADAAGGGIPVPPQGRLTLQTGTPVMTTTNSAKTTIFYSPFCGDKVPIYNGSVFTMTTFTELSVLTTDTTKSPAAIGANKLNDWYVWNDAGTIRLSHANDWIAVDRTGSIPLVRVGGIWLNGSSITNGPAAQRGTYVGTTFSNGSSQLDWILGSKAAGGGAAIFNVWNCYNRVDTATMVTMTDGSWSLSGGVFTQAIGSSNMRCSFVTGLAEDYFNASYAVMCVASAGASCSAGIGLDTTTGINGIIGFAGLSNAVQIIGSYSGAVLGAHFVQAMEHSSSTPGSFYGTVGAPECQAGLQFQLRM